MASTYTTLSSFLTAVSDAIRAKTGETGKINAQNIPAKIAAIKTAKEISYVETENSAGGITVTVDTGVSGGL